MSKLLAFYHVTPVGFDDGTRELIIDEDDISLKAIGSGSPSPDVEVIPSCDSRVWSVPIIIGIVGATVVPGVAVG